MGRAKVSAFTAEENADTLLSGTGDLVTKHLEKIRHSLPFLLWGLFFLFWSGLGFFFGGKVWLHRFLILLAKFVWQWNITHRRSWSGRQCYCEAIAIFERSYQTWEVSGDWRRKREQEEGSGVIIRLVISRVSYRACHHGSNFRAHKGQDDWEQPAWIYQAQIVPDQQ